MGSVPLGTRSYHGDGDVNIYVNGRVKTIVTQIMGT